MHEIIHSGGEFIKIPIIDMKVECPKKESKKIWMHDCYSFCDSYITGAVGSGLPGAEKKIWCAYPHVVRCAKCIRDVRYGQCNAAEFHVSVEK